MNIDKLIKIIESSNIAAEQKSELIKQLKYNRTKDMIHTILQYLGIGADIISLFKD